MKVARPSDAHTPLGDLRQAVAHFTAERRWQPYHTPKNLAMSIAIEAAELMELFQWGQAADSRRHLQEAAFRARVADELADVLIYCLSLANRAGVDLSSAVMAKLERNESRFPAADVREGKIRPEDPS